MGNYLANYKYISLGKIGRGKRFFMGEGVKGKCMLNAFYSLYIYYTVCTGKRIYFFYIQTLCYKVQLFKLCISACSVILPQKAFMKSNTAYTNNEILKMKTFYLPTNIILDLFCLLVIPYTWIHYYFIIVITKSWTTTLNIRCILIWKKVFFKSIIWFISFQTISEIIRIKN